MAKGSDRPPKFEEAIEQLEAIIDQIESGQIGLEEAIAQYERGVKLVAACQSILNKARQRIAELTADSGGKLEIKDQGNGGDPADDEAEAE